MNTITHVFYKPQMRLSRSPAAWLHSLAQFLKGQMDVAGGFAPYTFTAKAEGHGQITVTCSEVQDGEDPVSLLAAAEAINLIKPSAVIASHVTLPVWEKLPVVAIEKPPAVKPRAVVKRRKRKVRKSPPRPVSPK